MDEALESKLQAHAEQLAALGAEVDRQRQGFTSRQSALNSRAALLIGSATIASGVQVSAGLESWRLLAVAATLMAALLGVIALWPRGGDEVDVAFFRNTMYTRLARETDLRLLNAKVLAHGKDEKSLRTRQAVLRIGFVALLVAILFTAIQAADNAAVPTVTPTPTIGATP